MKTTELRIGNFIQDQFGDIITVDGLDDMDVFSSDCGDIPVHAVQPIPLTEQWLLDFGFKICTKSGVHNGWGIGENPLTHDYFLFLAWMKNEDGTLAELFYRNGYHTIKYVHQLQNLFFALAQEELILKEEEKPLFVTEDGVEIFEGDEYIAIGINYDFRKVDTVAHDQVYSGDVMRFKYESNADEYIVKNKPVFSYEDFVRWGNVPYERVIKQLAKERIEQ